MSKVEDLKRKQINKVAAAYLCDQEDGDLYDAYLRLQEAKELNDGEAYANDFIDVWESLETLSVNEMIELIDSSLSAIDVPEFPLYINWSLLKQQKSDLIHTIVDLEAEQSENMQSRIDSLNGILYMIDAIQDYAVDVIGIDENLVFKLSDED
jgi:hypothetical protein